jgi:hypothetical protein
MDILAPLTEYRALIGQFKTISAGMCQRLISNTLQPFSYLSCILSNIYTHLWSDAIALTLFRTNDIDLLI